MNSIKTDNRSYYWDNVKGCLIFLIVLAHFLLPFRDGYNWIGIVFDYIYMFHVAVFVFVSGYYGKSEHSYSAESIIKLVLLYFVFNSVTGFADGFVSLLIPMYSCWYLIALIVWRITSPYLANCKYVTLILFFSAEIAGYYSDINNTFAIARIIGFFPLYILGYKLKSENVVRIQNYIYIKRFAIGILFFAFAGIIAFSARKIFKYTVFELEMGNYNDIYDVFGRVMLYVVSISMIVFFLGVSVDRNIPFISMFGRNSLCIFVFHRLLVLWLGRLLVSFSPIWIFFLSFMLSFILCFLLGNDYVSKCMNKFMKESVSIFLDGTNKIGVPSLVLMFIYLMYFYYILINIFTTI